MSRGHSLPVKLSNEVFESSIAKNYVSGVQLRSNSELNRVQWIEFN